MKKVLSKKMIVSSKGFTLIELLVVIAIIAMLSNIIFSAVGIARNKGYNAAVKSNLQNFKIQAQLFYEDNNYTYNGVCNDPKAKPIFDAARSAGKQPILNGQCQSGPGAGGLNYIGDVELRTGGYWCIDSTGVSRYEGSAVATNPVLWICP